MVTPACTTAVDSTGDRTPTHGQIVTEPRSHGTVTDPIRTDCLVPGGEARPAQVDPQGHPTDPGHDSARVKRQRDGSRVGPLADRAGSSASAPLELRRPVRRCASAANSPPSRPAPVVNRSRRCSSMNLTIASTGGRAPPRRRPRPSSRCVRPPQLTVLRLRISEQVLDQTDRPVPHPLRILLRVPARRHLSRDQGLHQTLGGPYSQSTPRGPHCPQLRPEAASRRPAPVARQAPGLPVPTSLRV
jgi:hypothetical protein